MEDPRSCKALPLLSALDFSVSAWNGARFEGTVNYSECLTIYNSGSTTPAGRVKEKMIISGSQVAAARELLGITQAELASVIGVAMQTIFRFEKGLGAPRSSTVQKIRAELELRGIEFTNGTGKGVRLDDAKAAAYVRSLNEARQ